MESDEESSIKAASASGGFEESHAPPEALGHTADQIETANHRILLYLKAIHTPLHKRYVIADDAITHAAISCPPGGNFVAESMRCLYALLKSYRNPSGKGQSETTRDSRYSSDFIALDDIFSQELSYVQDVPLLNRGNMIPVDLERTGPLTFFFMLFLKLITFPFRSPRRLYSLLVMLAGAMFFYWWYYFLR